jgi:DNA-binding transcriptional ArsR family regulator
VALIRDPVVRQIAGFLKIAGHATPGEIAFALGLKRRTLTRKLRLLRRTGLCRVTGKTRAARYVFRVDFARN